MTWRTEAFLHLNTHRERKTIKDHVGHQRRPQYVSTQVSAANGNYLEILKTNLCRSQQFNTFLLSFLFFTFLFNIIRVPVLVLFNPAVSRNWKFSISANSRPNICLSMFGPRINKSLLHLEHDWDWLRGPWNQRCKRGTNVQMFANFKWSRSTTDVVLGSKWGDITFGWTILFGELSKFVFNSGDMSWCCVMTVLTFSPVPSCLWPAATTCADTTSCARRGELVDIGGRKHFAKFPRDRRAAAWGRVHREAGGQGAAR